MLGADLHVSLELLVQKPIIDGNHVTALQVRRDLVDGLERSLVENRLTNWPLDKHKLIAVEAYQFFSSITDQAYRHCVE